ncbi:MAG TPA: ATP-binding protein [Burkholderiales bacterium]|nr:ATP-binding protein [Burkholderiales bacterium]
MPSQGVSLRRRILLPAAVLLLITGAASSAVSFYLAKGEANELLDYQLEQLCRVVAADGITRPGTVLPPNERDADAEDDFVVYVWDEEGRLVHSTLGSPAIDQPRSGFSSVAAGAARWRVFSQQVGDRRYAVAQRLDLRTELAGAGALQALLPVLALIPLLGLTIGWIVLRSLKPLRALSADVARRAATDLRALPEHDLPDEVRPLVHAMNGLLARLDEALTRQKRFVADAAHELRTPLAALQIQAEMLEGAAQDGERRRRAQALRGGIARLAGLVSQLLAMARLDAAAPSALVELDLLEVVKSVLADLYPLAESRSINLGLTEGERLPIRGYLPGLRALFANLIDNALRYTPGGGQVDVSVRRGPRGALVTVADTGPGIAPEHLERVFERFYRIGESEVSGHGLGLAIARAAAEQHHAQLSLENRRDGPGLCASVEFAA